MSVSEIQNSLVRYKRPLAVVVCLAIVLCALLLNVVQSCTAQVYIRYDGSQAPLGLTQNGEKLDPYEISNVQIVTKALERMGMAGSNSNQMIRGITVTPIQSVAELEKYDAWIDSFDSYEEDEADKAFPVHYRISFKTNRGETFAWGFLAALIDVYSEYYAESYGWHSNVSVLPAEVVQEQDYWNVIRTLHGKLDSVKSALNAIETDDLNYRSPSTGWSVRDLTDALSFLQQTKLAGTEQYILENGVSRDREVLCADLTVKADAAGQGSARSDELAQTRRALMDKYSERNRDYLWQDSADEETIQIREDIEGNGWHNQELTTYDQLMVEFVGHQVDSKNQEFDSRAYREQVERFSTGGDDNGMAEQRLNEICTEFEELFEITEKTLEDYNLFKQSRNITQLSGIAVRDTVNEPVNYVTSVVLSLGLGVVAVIFVELKRRGII